MYIYIYTCETTNESIFRRPFKGLNNGHASNSSNIIPFLGRQKDPIFFRGFAAHGL